MIKSETIKVTLKPNLVKQIADTVIAVLHLKTSENQRTIKKWLKANSDKLTHYSFLLALSEIFSLSIEDLVNIERIKP